MPQQRRGVGGGAQPKGLEDGGVAFLRHIGRSAEGRLGEERYGCVIRVERHPFFSADIEHLRAEVEQGDAVAFGQVVVSRVPARARRDFQTMSMGFLGQSAAFAEDASGAFGEVNIGVEGGGCAVVDKGDVGVLREG